MLGMAIFYKTKNLISLTEDENDRVVVLKPFENKLTYYFLAAWNRSQGG